MNDDNQTVALEIKEKNNEHDGIPVLDSKISNREVNNNEYIRIQALKDQRNKNDKMKDEYSRRRGLLILLVCIVVIFSIGMLFVINSSKYIFLPNSKQKYLVSILLVVIMLMYIPMVIIYEWKINNKISDIEASKERIDEELEILELRNITIEEKAEKQFKQHQKELNRYYNENIRHMRGVYNIGIFTIASGLLLIVGTIILCIVKPEFINDYIVPVMGIISGLASSLIGSLFIKMYTETINTSSKFHDKLVYSNNLHFSNFLISKVENKDKRENAICEIIKIISSSKGIENKKEL